MSGGKHLEKGSQKPELPDDGLLRLFAMRFCPYTQRVLLILAVKKIPYHTININLSEPPEWLTEFSPLGKVPALQLAAESKRPTLIESLIIVEYLDEKYPENPILPKDTLQRALDKILVERFSAVITPYYKVAKHKEMSALSDVIKGLDIFEKELRERGHDYFGGEKAGFVDYMIWPWCERCDMFQYMIPNKYEMDKERFEHLLKWRELMLKDEAVKEFYLDGETHAKFMGSLNYNMLFNEAKRPKIS